VKNTQFKGFKRFTLVLATIAGLTLTGPVASAPAQAASGCTSTMCAHLIVHYKRNDPSKYNDWGLWLWALKGVNLPATKTPTPFSNSTLDTKGLAVIDTYVPISSGVTQLGLIPRLKTSWTKDVDADRVVQLNSNHFAEIWIKEGDAYLYKDDTFIIPREIWGASIETFRTIKVTLSKTNSTAGQGFSISGEGAPEILSATKILDLYSGTVASGRQWLITTKSDIPLGSVLTLNHNDAEPLKVFGSRQIIASGVFNSQGFIDAYTYTGDDLGATYTAAKTDFRVWAPTASEVELATYSSATLAADQAVVTPMTKSVNGTWIASLNGNKNGQIYNYRVTVGGNTEEAVDPYARSVTMNGNRGVVLDLSKTDPAGWATQAKPTFSGKSSDAVMYELHIRDASKDASSGVSATNRGKYLGLAQLGTSVKVGKKTGTTGLSYFKELGVTHIQLLPFYDYASGGSEDSPEFNWGYDPKNFNSPEGQYSSNPANPVLRVKELKTAIQAIHKAGLRVTMDVVYGHVASATEFSEQLIVPGYWFRRDASGMLTNGSGCGNDVATERPMVRKFIVDSMKYWTKEYKLDGFRIDQMGLWDVTTLNAVRTGVSTIEPKATILGEAWSMGPSIGVPQGTQGQLVNMRGLGAFNDGIRNAVKGSPDGMDGGYVNGNASGALGALKAGTIGHTSADTLVVPWLTLDAGQSVNYAEAHDNSTLFDKLWSVNGGASRAEVAKQDRQVAALVLLAQGTPFIQAGQEFLRTKEGETNSYNLPDSINSLKWKQRLSESITVDYYKGLIALRKAHPAFRMSKPSDISANLTFLDAPADILAYELNGKAVKDKWSTVVVISNPNSSAKKVSLPETGNWKIVVQGDKAGTTVLATLKGAGSVSVGAHSTLVIYK